MNKLGISLWNWEKGLGDGCLGLPEHIRSLGFTALELPMTEPEISDALAREVRASGLAVSLCAALGPGRDLSNFDPAIRSATMDYMTRCLETGAQVGATVFAGPLYAGGGKRHFLSPDDKKREWELAVGNLQILAARAQDLGIALALEPLNRYRTSVVNTVEQVISLMNDIDRSNVGILYDTYHGCLEEADLLRSLELALATGKVYHFHACANNRGGPGQGLVPWEQVFALLKKAAYSHHITMETFALGGLDSSFVNVHGSADSVAQKGISYLKQYFA